MSDSIFKYVVVYCYEQTRNDGIISRIVTEGIYDDPVEAEEVAQSVWDRFEPSFDNRRPEYIHDVEVITVEFST